MTFSKKKFKEEIKPDLTKALVWYWGSSPWNKKNNKETILKVVNQKIDEAVTKALEEVQNAPMSKGNWQRVLHQTIDKILNE